MANRRFGNQCPPGQRGGGHASNRAFVPTSNISPWQGGAPPGVASPQNIQNQLALALSNLIQQSAQQPAHDSGAGGPPSLLNLNTSPGFFNQDHFASPPSHAPRFSANRGRQDFRRFEPFNKNRMSGWRSDNAINRHRAPSCSYSSPQTNLSNSRDTKGGQRTASSKKLAIDKSLPKQETDAANANGNTGESPAPALPSLQPAKLVEAHDSKHGVKKPDGVSLYEGIPNGLLHCCVCNKSMWDGESFQNHLGGKAHKQMVQSLEESFQITVNILRENMRLSEERKLIEYERVKRSRRFFHAPSEPESMCNMCDLKFMGKIVLHRQSEGHQRLKRFLHPKCTKCHVEFTARMEWVDHLFMPEHLLKVREYMDAHDTEYGEYKHVLKVDMDNDPLLEENMQNEDDHPVLELSDDLNNLFNRIPVYKRERAVSRASLKPAVGSICELCSVFMASEEEAQEHLRTYKHYIKFVETVKSKYQRSVHEKKVEPVVMVKVEGSADAKIEAEVIVKPKEAQQVGDEEDDEMYDKTMNKMLDDMYCEAKEEAGIGSTTDETKETEQKGEEVNQVEGNANMRVTRRSAKLRQGEAATESPAKKSRM